MFTWNENVALCIIPFIGDPGLVIYFMSILKPMRRDYVEEESREWHKSLRITQEERWLRVAELRNKKRFSEMNSSVPITCTLPFDGGMWRNSRDLLKMIRYFREEFIRREDLDYLDDDLVSNKIKIVNLLYEESMRANIFRRISSISDIYEALNDLITFKDPDTSEEYSDLDESMMPYITVIGRIDIIPSKDWRCKNYIGNDLLRDLPHIAIRN
jgi:hypothetical protein